MTLVRGTVLDVPDDPFAGGRLRSEEDAGLLVRDGVVVERGGFDAVRRRHPDEEVLDLRGGLVLPGLVDAHVHYPQVRAVGGLGMPLLEWLDRCALPEEVRLADREYARGVARDFVRCLADAGTTTALVFGSHFPGAVDALFAEAERGGLRVTSGLVVSDRRLRPELHVDAARAHDDGMALAQRWHGRGRLRYAVTPRFALSCSGPVLDACAELLGQVDGALCTSHVNESRSEVTLVRELFGTSYVGAYERHGLLGPRTVLAHDVHPGDDELDVLASSGTAVAHCPTSNAALGSGLFPMARHLARGVRVALGSDVGAGAGFCLFKEGLQAYFAQQLLGPDGVALGSAHLLHLATRAGALALGLDDVGHLGVGMRFDALHLRPPAGCSLDVALRSADGPEDALAKAFSLAHPHDVVGTWVDGEAVRMGEPVP